MGNIQPTSKKCFNYKYPYKSPRQICWILLFIFFAWSGYGYAGKTGMVYLLFLEILSFPSNFIFELISSLLKYEVGNVPLTWFPIIILFLTGYLQWFVIFPFIWAIAKNNINRNSTD